jgi:hypothetical protein
MCNSAPRHEARALTSTRSPCRLPIRYSCQSGFIHLLVRCGFLANEMGVAQILEGTQCRTLRGGLQTIQISKPTGHPTIASNPTRRQSFPRLSASKQAQMMLPNMRQTITATADRISIQCVPPCASYYSWLRSIFGPFKSWPQVDTCSPASSCVIARSESPSDAAISFPAPRRRDEARTRLLRRGLLAMTGWRNRRLRMTPGTDLSSPLSLSGQPHSDDRRRETVDSQLRDADPGSA